MIKSRADLYPVAPPLVPPAVNTLLRGSALNLWQADGTELKKLNATHRSHCSWAARTVRAGGRPCPAFCGVDTTPPEGEPGARVEAPAPAPAPQEEPEPDPARARQRPVYWPSC